MWQYRREGHPAAVELLLHLDDHVELRSVNVLLCVISSVSITNNRALFSNNRLIIPNVKLLFRVISPISLDQFAWSHEQSLFYLGILLPSGTACSCVVFLLLPQLCKRFSEHNVFVYFAMLPLFLSQIVMIPIGSNQIQIAVPQNGSDTGPTNGCSSSQEWCNSVPAINHYQLVVSYALLCISFSVGIAISQTILSKHLGTRPQGNWMALYTSIGGIMRIIGPGGVMIYVSLGTYWLFGLGSAVSGLVLTWVWLCKGHLRYSRKSIAAAEVQLMMIESKQ